MRHPRSWSFKNQCTLRPNRWGKQHLCSSRLLFWAEQFNNVIVGPWARTKAPYLLLLSSVDKKMWGRQLDWFDSLLSGTLGMSAEDWAITKKSSIRWIRIVLQANDYRWKWGDQHPGDVCVQKHKHQQRFRVTEQRCDYMKLCRDHIRCVFYKLAVKVIILPLLPLRPFRNHHTMPFSSLRRSKASQRCISHGKLSISADEMATWKTSPNRSPSPPLYLLISHYHPLDFNLSLSPPEAWV